MSRLWNQNRVLKLIFLSIFLTLNLSLYANEDDIKSKLEFEFLRENDNLEIENIDLKFTSRVDLSGLKLKNIVINRATLKRNIGTFKAIFEKDGREKSIFYRYKIVGKILVLKVNKDLKKGDLISEEDISYEKVDFKYTPYEYLLNKEILKRALLKRDIPKDTIITKNLIDIISDIKKGDSIVAILKEGAISIKFEATALNDGYIGEIIRVKSTKGVIFNGKIISEKKVEIQ